MLRNVLPPNISTPRLTTKGVIHASCSTYVYTTQTKERLRILLKCFDDVYQLLSVEWATSSGEGLVYIYRPPAPCRPVPALGGAIIFDIFSWLGTRRAPC